MSEYNELVYEDMIAGKITAIDCPLCEGKNTFSFTRIEGISPAVKCSNCGYCITVETTYVARVGSSWTLNVEIAREEYKKQLEQEIQELEQKITERRDILKKIEINSLESA